MQHGGSVHHAPEKHNVRVVARNAGRIATQQTNRLPQFVD